jgi:voltage-gated potassium channel
MIKSHPSRKIAEFAFTIVALIFIATCVLLVVERDTFKTFHQTFYFVVVSITTVGYGDLHAETALGQVVVVAMLLTALTLIPIQGYYLNKFLREKKTKFEFSYYGDKPHVLVIGCINAVSLEIFLRKFESENIDNYKVVVLHTEDPLENEDLGKVLYIQKFLSVLYYFRGNPLIKDDLKRVHIDTALACFVLNDPSSADSGHLDK